MPEAVIVCPSNVIINFSMSKKLIVAILLCVVSIYSLKAQINIDYANPKTYVVADIKVSGVKFLNHSALIQLSGLRKGSKVKIPGEDLTRSVRKLWRQGLFSDVQIGYTKIKGDSIYLDIYLQERSRLSQVVFLGVSKSKSKDLREKLGKDIKKGKQITDNVLSKIKSTVRNHFVDKGFYNIKVATFSKPDTVYQNAVVLYVNIKKGKRVKIKSITFSGNTLFKERKLRRFLKNTKQKRWYRIFKMSKYVPEKYKADKKRLISKLNEKGYRDAKIIKDKLVKNPDNTLSLSLDIEEGNKYYFGDIKWIGNTKFSSKILSKALKIKKGDVYDQVLLDKRLTVDEDAVGNLYMDNGYLFFNIRAVEKNIDNDSVDIELRMYEGAKARINKVTITGNDRTNDNIIRRELFTVPGELFSKSDIIRSVRKLANLGHFDPEKIIPTPIPNPSNGTVDLEYSLVERGSDRIEISGGWGAKMLIGRVGLSFNNFSIQNIFEKKAWRPLPTGDGQKFSINAQTNGSAYQYYSISFQEPWLGGKKPNSLSVTLYYNIQTNRSFYNFNPKKLRRARVGGVTVGFGRRLKWPDNDFTLYHSVGYQNYILEDWQYRSYIKNIQDGRYHNFTVSTIFGRNSIDNPLYSRRGSEFSIGLELTPPYSLLNNKDYSSLSKQEKYKWLEYHKWTFKTRWFTQIWGDLVFHTKTEFGNIGYYNREVGYSPLGGYSLGGSGMAFYSHGIDIIGLRGYKDGELTPREGANIYTKYTMELRYPVIFNESATVFALIFAEAGNAWANKKNFNPFVVKRSAGAGVRIFLPMLGQLGFDWGYGFDPAAGEGKPNGGEFHFTMGQQF